MGWVAVVATLSPLCTILRRLILSRVKGFIFDYLVAAGGRTIEETKTVGENYSISGGIARDEMSAACRDFTVIETCL